MFTDEAIFLSNETHHLTQKIRQPLYLIQDKTTFLVEPIDENSLKTRNNFTLIGVLPALYPERLGSEEFLKTHQLRFPYIVGEMANGIATAEMVVAANRIGCIGFFGAAGLPADIVLKNIIFIHSQLRSNQINWGANLIHSPYEPTLEEKITQIYLEQNVRRVSASAYMKINPNIVHYACKGLYQDQQGQICRSNYVFAKISRQEVAKQFMEPPPPEILQHLLETRKISAEEAQLARHIPIAQDITVESDSGGHTDNRPLGALFPTIQLLEMQIRKQYHYKEPVRLGCAGGIGTPNTAAAAFGLGAAYILTGSINQSAVESGLSEEGKKLLSLADVTDIAMAPAADMFELGVNVQVLKRGTLFSSRAKKLFDLYKSYPSLEAIPSDEKIKLEQTIFKMPLESVWQQTTHFFQARNPKELEKANKDAKYQMALTFRWYLGLSSAWSIQGNHERTLDYQIWCGPAMGAFNCWVKESFLEPLANRTTAQIALNLLEGAAVTTRAQQLRTYHVEIPQEAFHFQPRLLSC